MATLTDLCQITVKLSFIPVGAVSAGMRIDIPFEGTATSSHWEGERKVTGVDYVTIGADGIQNLDIRGLIGEGPDVVSYRAIGKGTDAGPRELLVFETASEDLAFLNSAIAVAIGSLDGSTLTLDVSQVDG